MSFHPDGYLLTPTDGRQWWVLDTRMVVKAGGDETGGAFTLIEWSAPIGFGPPRHQHNAEDEAFYLLDGEMVVHCGEKRWTVGAGDFVFLPRGIPHGFVVTGGPARGLQLTSPAGFEQFVSDIGRPATEPGLPVPSAPDLERLAAATARRGDLILGPPLTLEGVEA
jgi:quercetin dioxygenase-like cupin family protein